VGLHGSPGHLELAGNFSVVAALQEQLDNLLFPRSQPNIVRTRHCIPLPQHRLSTRKVR